MEVVGTYFKALSSDWWIPLKPTIGICRKGAKIWTGFFKDTNHQGVWLHHRTDRRTSETVACSQSRVAKWSVAQSVPYRKACEEELWHHRTQVQSDTAYCSLLWRVISHPPNIKQTLATVLVCTWLGIMYVYSATTWAQRRSQEREHSDINCSTFLLFLVLEAISSRSYQNHHFQR